LWRYQPKATTTTVVKLLVVARVLYFAVYLLGLPWIRSCLWLTGLLCTIYMYVFCIGQA